MVDVGAPDAAQVIGHVQHIAIVIRSEAVIDFRSGAGDGGEVLVLGGIAQGQEAHGVRAGRVAGIGELPIADVVDQGLLLGGELGAVGDAVGSVELVDQAGVGAGDHFTGGGIHLIGHVAVVQHPELGAVGGQGCGDGILGDRGAGGPDLIVGGIPGVEPGLVVAVDEDTGEVHIQNGDRHLAGSRDAGIRSGGCRDVGGSDAHTGDEAVGVHRGDLGVVRGPGDRAVRGVPGHDLGGELQGLIPEELRLGLVQRHRGDLAVGIEPVVGVFAPVGEDNGRDIVEEVAVLTAGGGSLGGELPELVAGGGLQHVVELAVRAVILQALVAPAVAGLQIAEGRGTIHGVQREGVQHGIAAIAGAVEEAAAGIGNGGGVIVGAAHIDLAQLRDGAAHAVHLDQHAGGGDGIEDAVVPVIGHVLEGDIQGADIGTLPEVVAGASVEVVVGVHIEDVGAHSRGGGDIRLAVKPAVHEDVAGLSGPVADHPLLGGGIEVQHLRHGAGLADGLLQLVGGLVDGVVHHLNDELVAVHVVQGDLQGHGVAGLGIGIGAAGSQQRPAGNIIEGNTCHLLVVAGGDAEDVVLVVHFHLFDGGGGVIHQEGDLQGVALVPLVLGVGVEVHHRGEGDRAALTLLHVGMEVDVIVGGGIGPGVIGLDVAGRVQLAALVQIDGLAVGVVRDGHAVSARVADQGKAQGGETVAPGQIDGVALGHIGLIGLHGVAAEVPVGAAVFAIGNGDGVIHQGVAEVGGTGLRAVHVLGVGAHIVHGSFVPAAVEGQHRQAQLGQELAFLRGQGSSLHKAFHIGAHGVVGGKAGLLRVREGHAHVHGDAAAGGDLHAGLAEGQEQVDIIGVHHAVPVEVGPGSVGGQGGALGHVVQQVLGIRGVTRPSPLKS